MSIFSWLFGAVVRPSEERRFDSREIAKLILDNLAAKNPDAAFSTSLSEICRLAGVPFDQALRSRYDRKVRIYSIASLHMAISTSERRHPAVFQIGAALIEATPDVHRHEVESALLPLAELTAPNFSRQPSWAKDWLREIGIDVGNPMTCMRFSYYWALTVVTDLKTIKELAETFGL